MPYVAKDAPKNIMAHRDNIIRLDSYRRDRKSQQLRIKRAKMHSGFNFAERALVILIEEAQRSGHNDIQAVWYTLARTSFEALRHMGWTTEDLIKLIKDAR